MVWKALKLAGEELSADDDDEDDEDGDDGDALAAANLAQLKVDALERFAIIADLFTKMGKAYEKHGYRSKPYDKLQEQISNELMQFRFSAKQVDALCDTMRNLVEEVRSPRAQHPGAVRHQGAHAASSFHQDLPRQ